jgi:hypothetical protein
MRGGIEGCAWAGGGRLEREPDHLLARGCPLVRKPIAPDCECREDRLVIRIGSVSTNNLGGRGRPDTDLLGRPRPPSNARQCGDPFRTTSGWCCSTSSIASPPSASASDDIDAGQELEDRDQALADSGLVVDDDNLHDRHAPPRRASRKQVGADIERAARRGSSRSRIPWEARKPPSPTLAAEVAAPFVHAQHDVVRTELRATRSAGAPGACSAARFVSASSRRD